MTLDHPATYQIMVPGALNDLWADDENSLTITIEEIAEGQLISIITGKMDQAALQVLLRRLYGVGLPLISFVWIDNL